VLIVDTEDIDKSWDLNLEDVRSKVESEGVQERELLLEKWHKLGEVKLDIAVIGNSGVGRSTFINAIRGLKDAEEAEAAEVGTTEKTVVIRDYRHPNNNSLKFWDLPGVGTDRFPKQTYLHDINVDYYDFFLLITAGRFTENDTWLGNELRKRNKKYFFVRTKIEVDISHDKSAHPRNHNEKDVIRDIRESTQRKMEENGVADVQVFLIDSHKPQKFDFCLLEKRLINKISDLKRSTLILSLQASSKVLIHLKAKEFRSEIYKVAYTSTMTDGEKTTISLYGVSTEIDIHRVREQAEFYHKQLGLDTISLKRLAKNTFTDYEQLRDIASRCRGCDDVEGCEEMVKELSKGTSSLVSGLGLLNRINSSWIPVLGFAVAKASCYSGTYYALKLILDHMESVALDVIEFSQQHIA